jgi:hypothetical protein
MKRSSEWKTLILAVIADILILIALCYYYCYHKTRP